MPTACLDTNIIIWGVKEEASDTQEAMIPRAKRLLQQLRDDKYQLIVPAIVLAEALVQVEAQDHPDFLRLMRRSFVISPFDGAVAGHFARLWYTYKQHPLVLEVIQNRERTRAMMKADCMIIATALSTRSAAIYTSNVKDFQRFRMPGLEIKDLPELPAPPPPRPEQQLLL
jgi:predicted nucleic acid-binding protein